MARIVNIILAAALPLAALATPVATQANANTGHYFTAQLAAPTEETNAIAGGVVFSCDGEVCTGPRSGDRPLRVCTELRREVGTLTSFAVRGEPISDALLARCNG